MDGEIELLVKKNDWGRFLEDKKKFDSSWAHEQKGLGVINGTFLEMIAFCLK